MKSTIQMLIVLVALGHGVATGHAQSAPAGDPGLQLPSSLAGSRLLPGGALGSGQGKADPHVSTITTGSSGAARKLAEAYPAAQRAAAERTFQALLGAYVQVESAVGIPAGDAAGALAAYAIVSFEAYSDADVDQKHYKPVIDQMRRALQANADFARATAAQKRELYEQMAIMGMFVAARRSEAKKSGDATALRAVRDAARQYISQGLKIDPDRMQIGGGGLIVAASGATAPDGASAPAAPPAASAPFSARPFSTERIKGVLFSWHQTYGAEGFGLSETTYLLFKDGTCTTELSKSLEDPAASKADDPKAWGRWRKQGALFEVAFEGSFFTPPGQKIREPARRGERLSGKWSASSGGSVGPDAIYWSNSSVTFSKDGRFETYSSGGSGATSGDTTSTTVYDDEGSATAVVNPNIGGGGKRRSGRTSADRTGTYSLDGYTLELHYDSGRVERHLFHTTPERDYIFFRGTEMWVGRQKK
jgi:hypothetical protein